MTTSTHIPKRYRVTSVTLTQSLCPSAPPITQSLLAPHLRSPASVVSDTIRAFLCLLSRNLIPDFSQNSIPSSLLLQ